MDRLEIREAPPGLETSRNPWIAVNGEELREIFRSANVAIPTKVARLPSRHLLDAPDSDLTVDGRAAILVCSQCGDIGCGALFVRVTLDDDQVIWSDFVHANNWDPDMDDPKEGRFVFDRREYELALA
jgi:hypothetical protein